VKNRFIKMGAFAPIFIKNTIQTATQLVIPAGNAGIHDCMDAEGRVTQEQLPRRHG
jgi:hypothetical protein